MRITVRHIQETVAEHFEVPLAYMKEDGRGRTERHCDPRHVAMFFARETTGLSLATIARLFGRRDHTTIRHAMLKVKRKASNNDAFAAEISELKKVIGTVDRTGPKPFCASFLRA